MSRTCVAAQRPPRAVGIPRALSCAAMPRYECTPAARISAITGASDRANRPCGTETGFVSRSSGAAAIENRPPTNFHPARPGGLRVVPSQPNLNFAPRWRVGRRCLRSAGLEERRADRIIPPRPIAHAVACPSAGRRDQLSSGIGPRRLAEPGRARQKRRSNFPARRQTKSEKPCAACHRRSLRFELPSNQYQGRQRSLP
jgi:hypothetical protein